MITIFTIDSSGKLEKFTAFTAREYIGIWWDYYLRYSCHRKPKNDRGEKCVKGRKLLHRIVSEQQNEAL